MFALTCCHIVSSQPCWHRASWRVTRERWPSLKGGSDGNTNTVADKSLADPTTEAKRLNELYAPRVLSVQDLTPYALRGWALRGRVVAKSAIREYSNARGSGKLFSFSLADLTGELKIVAFNRDCERYYERVIVDRVLLVAQATIKTADKRYSKAEVEITLNSESVVEDVTGEEAAKLLPNIAYNFKPLSQLEDSEANELVDIIGVLLELSEIATIVSRTTLRQLRKRSFLLADQSGHTISATLWGATADQFSAARGDIVVLRAAKVSTYGGRSLSANDMPTLNPDLHEASSLRAWFFEADLDSLKHLTKDAQTARNSTATAASAWCKLEQLNDCELVRQLASRRELVKCKVTVSRVDENMFYKCCLAEGCGKKLTVCAGAGAGGGSSSSTNSTEALECTKCNRRAAEFKYRLMVKATICDDTSGCEVILWDENAEVVVGMTPDQAAEMLATERRVRMEKRFRNRLSSDYIMTMKPRIDTYGGTERVRSNVVGVTMVDPAERVKQLLAGTATRAQAKSCQELVQAPLDAGQPGVGNPSTASGAGAAQPEQVVPSDLDDW